MFGSGSRIANIVARENILSLQCLLHLTIIRLTDFKDHRIYGILLLDNLCTQRRDRIG